MNRCFVDVTTEFLAVAFNNILYYTSVYPESVFETRKKYSVVVHRCIHPEVEQYINLCLKNASECMKNGHLSMIEFAVTDIDYNPLMKFIFQIEQNQNYDETNDAYLIQCEQNLRGFCLILASSSHKLKQLPEDCSFSISLHTNESMAVSIASNPGLQDFPLVEVKVNENSREMQQIIPLRRFSILHCSIDTFIEII